MTRDQLSRRDFHQLTMAAFGGAVVGTLAGCGQTPPAAPPQGSTPAPPTGGEPVAMAEMHACRGLNQCKGQGTPGTNDCAGKGSCAPETAHHACATQNACKNQGGCGDTPGYNECKTMGGCHVPLEGGMWKSAREEFEKRMKAAGKPFGPAPEPAMG